MKKYKYVFVGLLSIIISVGFINVLPVQAVDTPDATSSVGARFQRLQALERKNSELIAQLLGIILEIRQAQNQLLRLAIEAEQAVDPSFSLPSSGPTAPITPSGTLAPPGGTLTVTYPRADTLASAGSNLPNYWTSSGILAGTLVNIQLLNAAGAVVAQVSNTHNDGIEAMPLPATLPPGQHRVRIATTNLTASGLSPWFTVSSAGQDDDSGRDDSAGASITVTYPRSDTLAVVGSNVSTFWNSAGVPRGVDGGTVTVAVLNSANSVVALVSNTPNDGSQAIPLPSSMTAGQHRVRINASVCTRAVRGVCQTMGTVEGHSPWFTVSAAAASVTTPATITVTYPRADTLASAGSNLPNYWTSSGILAGTLVNIQLLNAAGAVVAQVSNTHNDGIEAMPLPATLPPGQHRVRIATTNLTASGLSPWFTVSAPAASITTPPASITVTHPNANTLGSAGSNVLTTWNSTGVPRGVDGGMVTVALLNSANSVVTQLSTPNDGSQAVLLPSNSTGQHRVRISADVSTRDIRGVSQSIGTVNGYSPWFSVTAQ